MISEDQSDNEEEIYVLVEFDDSVNIEKYRNIHVLSIDTKNPLVQLDDTFYSGSYETPLGTHLFFEEDLSAQTNDPLFDKLPQKCLRYLTKARKTIKAEHVYVKPKEDTEDNKELRPDEEESNITPVTFTSVAEAVEKLKRDWMATYSDLFNENKKATK